MREALLDGNYLIGDTEFDNLYPRHIQQLSGKHWTPVSIAEKAARFLAEQQDVRILDIGSGVGKFCLVAASLQPHSHFFGIEQRESLTALAENAKHETGIQNATFLNGNFISLDLDQFDHFYFYNSFYENLVNEDLHIDESVDHSLSLYEHYSYSLYEALDRKCRGTRLATYHGFREIVPRSFQLVESYNDGILKHWIKK